MIFREKKLILRYNVAMNTDSNKIEAMRTGGKLLKSMLDQIKAQIRVGLDVYELEELFIKLCKESGAEPACKGYRVAGLPPFPTGLCVGINAESVHCYPKKGTVLQEGDLISVDTVIKYQGWHVDSAFTVGVGKISEIDRKFLEAALMASNSSLKEAVAGKHIGDIGYVMESIMQMSGFDVLSDFVGHGIGREMHEAPDIPCFGDRGRGPNIKVGQTLAIEALTCQGGSEVEYVNRNDWQTQMSDGGKFAIFEHTVLITENGPEVLTR